MRTLLFGCLLGSSLLLWNCNRNEVISVPDRGDDFFPLKIGNTWIYEVDSIIFDPTNRGVVLDTNQIQIKETITGSYLDAAGQEVFVIERTERLNETAPWQIKDVWTTYTTSTEAIRVEENLAFIKLPFPFKARQTWNANVNIANGFSISVAGEKIDIFKYWNSAIIHADTNVVLDGKTYNQVALVALADNENLIEYRWGREYYAKQVGLIYREVRVLDTQKIDPNTDWEEKAEKGFIVKQRLLRYN